MAPIWQPCKDTQTPFSSQSALHADWPVLPPLCSVFVVYKVRSHLAALKSSGSVASNSSATTPPVVSRSHSFSEPLAPSFENLHLRNSQEPHQHHHPPSSSPSSSSSSTPARTDPQHPHPQPRPSPHEPALSEEVPPRVRSDRNEAPPQCSLAAVRCLTQQNNHPDSQEIKLSFIHHFNSVPPSAWFLLLSIIH